MNKLDQSPVRPVNIRRYVSLMRDRGFSPTATLAGTGIDEHQLLSDDCLLDLEQSEMVIRNLLRLSGDPALGFTFGRAIHLHQLGIVGHAMMSSASLGQSIRQWLEYGPALLGVLTRMQLDERAGGHWSYTIFRQTNDLDVYRFSVEESLTFGIELSRSWAGRPLDLVQARFAYPAPSPALVKIYEEVFQAPLVFDSETTTLEIRGPRLSQRLTTADVYFSEICSHQCTRALERLNSSTSVQSRLRALLSEHLNEFPDVERAARDLGMSVRTLRRRLHSEGTSYRKLLKDIQRERAIACLKEDRLSSKQASYTLGFRHPNDFTRAFKTWTGSTVTRFLNESDAP